MTFKHHIMYFLSVKDVASIRVLHLSKCMDYDRVVRNPFPRLVELRLHLCSVSLGLLRGVIDAAPLLATLHLG
ncbi:hypothetical protein D1007_01299 [Hordeum vulgare]|nr:hypothetical protein D1007_01299 [Hordeum vulgare]